jgi:hypothetical protein
MQNQLTKNYAILTNQTRPNLQHQIHIIKHLQYQPNKAFQEPEKIKINIQRS